MRVLLDELALFRILVNLAAVRGLVVVHMTTAVGAGFGFERRIGIKCFAF